MEWGRGELMYAAQATLDQKDVFVPGEKQCRWCKAAPGCEALKDFANKAAQDTFGVVPAPELLTVEEMATVLDKAATIKVWISAVESHALQQAENGRIPPGYKLVEKRGKKKWREGHDWTYIAPLSQPDGTRDEGGDYRCHPRTVHQDHGARPGDLSDSLRVDQARHEARDRTTLPQRRLSNA
jgi:hypothetical protein